MDLEKLFAPPAQVPPEQRFAVDYAYGDVRLEDAAFLDWPLGGRKNYVCVPIASSVGHGVPDHLKDQIKNALGWSGRSTVYIGYDPERNIWRAHEQWDFDVEVRSGSHKVFSGTMREFEPMHSFEDALGFAEALEQEALIHDPQCLQNWEIVRRDIQQVASRQPRWTEAAGAYCVTPTRHSPHQLQSNLPLRLV